MENESSKRGFWVHPWSYQESFAVACGVLLAGVLIDYALPQLPLYRPQFPNNVLFLAIFVSILLALQAFGGKSAFSRRLSSLPAAISSIVLFSALTFVMGLTTQNETSPEPLLRLTNTWMFGFAYLYLLACLGMISVRRLFPFTGKNIGFALNHWGLWFVLAFTGLGAADIENLSTMIGKEQPVWYAEDTRGNVKELDIALQLNEFRMETFPPKLALIDNKTKDVAQNAGKPIIAQIPDSGIIMLGNVQVYVAQYFASAYPAAKGFARADGLGQPAAQVKVGKEEGWLYAGSYMLPIVDVAVNERFSLRLLTPDPKSFESKIKCFVKDGPVIDTITRVNGPVQINGWTIYQTGYDDTRGKWSEISILQLVRDPWLPAVYISCFMMIIGAIYLAFFAKTNEKTE